jgi:hypothetical protein
MLEQIVLAQIEEDEDEAARKHPPRQHFNNQGTRDARERAGS